MLPRVEATAILLRSRGGPLAVILLPPALRLPGLGLRPMHAGEAVHADKFATLLEGGWYLYDPTEYHGPTVHHLTRPSACLRGATRHVEIDVAVVTSPPAGPPVGI